MSAIQVWKAQTVIYRCKTCRVARRVEYTPMQQPRGVWISATGGGGPTVYGGDVANGVCSCGRMMDYGVLVARLRPEIVCDRRRTSALGSSCDCSCGGVNHGIGYR